jgi:hypothetical protein
MTRMTCGSNDSIGFFIVSNQGIGRAKRAELIGQ